MTLVGIVVLAGSLVLAPFSATVGRAGPGGTGAVATGRGGAAASADEYATRAAVEIFAKGGNAVDAAVATAAVLGVTKPFWCGIGGGGFMMIYLASEHG
jgi:gamma-glutamyltranspeptidase/glutathione hydrolase